MYSKMQGRAGRMGMGGFETVLRRDHHHLAVLTSARTRRRRYRVRTSRREHVGWPKATDYKRAEANGIARADEHVIGQTHKGIGALDLAQGFDKASTICRFWNGR